MTNDVQPDGHRPHVRHNRDGTAAAIRRPWPAGRGLGVYTWTRLGIWIAIGLVIYFAYGRFQSRLRAK